MKNHSFNRVTILGCVILSALTLVSPAKAQNRQSGRVQITAENDSSNEKLRITVQPLLTTSDKAVIPGGGSVLVRTGEGVYMSLHSFGLTPGTAVTAWFVF